MNYKKYLTDDILPYWLEITPDKECGGIFTVFDSTGHPDPSEKNIWCLGRTMWTYALTYRLHEKRLEYLAACEHIFRFFDKCTLPGDRLPFLCFRDGKPKTVRPVYYYSEMFAAMGCAQYYRICKREEVWDRAERFFNTVYDLYKQNAFSTQEINVDTECKTFGLHMAMLATAQCMRSVGINTPLYEEAVSMAVAEIIHGGFVDDEHRQVNEYVSLFGEKLPGPLGAISCPGHIYEAAWFVMSEGELKDDDALRQFGCKLVDYAMPDGFDPATELIPTDRNLSVPVANNGIEKYLAWPQQEAIIAYRVAYSITGNPEYSSASKSIEHTLMTYYEHFSDCIKYREIYKKLGTYCNSSKTGCHIAGPFHLERMLLALDTLESTGSIQKYME